MGMWRLVECSGEEEPREFPGLRQNWVRKYNGKKEEILVGDDVFGLICLISGACGVSTYGCLVDYWLYIGFRTHETDVGWRHPFRNHFISSIFILVPTLRSFHPCRPPIYWSYNLSASLAPCTASSLPCSALIPWSVIIVPCFIPLTWQNYNPGLFQPPTYCIPLPIQPNMAIVEKQTTSLTRVTDVYSQSGTYMLPGSHSVTVVHSFSSLPRCLLYTFTPLFRLSVPPLSSSLLLADDLVSTFSEKTEAICRELPYAFHYHLLLLLLFFISYINV